MFLDADIHTRQILSTAKSEIYQDKQIERRQL